MMKRPIGLAGWLARSVLPLERQSMLEENAPQTSKGENSETIGKGG